MSVHFAPTMTTVVELTQSLHHHIEVRSAVALFDSCTTASRLQQDRDFATEKVQSRLWALSHLFDCDIAIPAIEV